MLKWSYEREGRREGAEKTSIKGGNKFKIC
jgi:hypothetical protein